MSRIVEELERQDINVTYENIAIFAVFASDEKLVEKLRLNTHLEPEDTDKDQGLLIQIFLDI